MSEHLENLEHPENIKKSEASKKQSSPKKHRKKRDAIARFNLLSRWRVRLRKRLRQLKKLTIIALVILIVGFLLPERTVNPVLGATDKDWNKKSFWYYPWGRSGAHRGVDIFGKKGQPVVSATDGFVVSVKDRSLGGKTITILGPKWRLHYYAHLNDRRVHLGKWVRAGKIIGHVGRTGNAVGKMPHVHYSISTIFPYIWQRDNGPYGSLKMWYVDPMPRL